MREKFMRTFAAVMMVLSLMTMLILPMFCMKPVF